MLSEMDATEFDEWQIFYSMEPFGERIAQQQRAQAAYIAGAQAGAKGKTVDDYMPQVKHQQTPGEMMAIIARAGKNSGG